VRRDKAEVSSKPPDLQPLYNLVRDRKSLEARRPLVSRQKARRRQANHKEIALRRGAAGDGRSTLWYTEPTEQFLADLTADFLGGTDGALRTGHTIHQGITRHVGQCGWRPSKLHRFPFKGEGECRCGTYQFAPRRT
jgi:hypothetical protein